MKIIINESQLRLIVENEEDNNLLDFESLIVESKLRGKKSPFGGFIRIDFTDGTDDIGYTNIRLKKGWNQLHIEIYPEFQRRGYAKLMIAYNIDEYGYVVFPSDRITNDMISKVISKFEMDDEYDVFRTSYDETVISNKSKSKEEILSTLK